MLALTVKKKPFQVVYNLFLLLRKQSEKKRVHYQPQCEPTLFFACDRVELPSHLSLSLSPGVHTPPEGGFWSFSMVS